MNYLFFDTETNGLPVNYNVGPENPDNWPRLVQFGYILQTTDAQVLEKGSFIVQPDGWTIPTEVTAINSLTTNRCKQEGIPLANALARILTLVDQADVIIGHNVNFDVQVVDSEFVRKDGSMPFSSKPRFDTMKQAVDFCKLPPHPGRSGYKNPKLIELHNILFGKDFEGAHDALADIVATCDCFHELVKKGIIDAARPLPPFCESRTPDAKNAALKEGEKASPAKYFTGFIVILVLLALLLKFFYM